MKRDLDKTFKELAVKESDYKRKYEILKEIYDSMFFTQEQVDKEIAENNRIMADCGSRGLRRAR